MFDTIYQASQTVFAGSSAHAEFCRACSCAGTTQFSSGSCYADTPTTPDTSTPNTLDTSASTSAASLEKERTTTVVISSLAFWILQIYNIKLKMHGETAFAILQVNKQSIFQKISRYLNGQNRRKSTLLECIFNNMALYFKYRITKTHSFRMFFGGFSHWDIYLVPCWSLHLPWQAFCHFIA